MCVVMHNAQAISVGVFVVCARKFGYGLWLAFSYVTAVVIDSSVNKSLTQIQRGK